MDLNDFGTECSHNDNNNNHHAAKPRQENPVYEREDAPESELVNRPIQWKVVQAGIFEVCGTTARQLPSGAYSVTLSQYGEVQIHQRDLQVDDLIDFADSLPGKILEEIQTFWTLGETFQRYGYLHRRGYLLYGPQGSGKSSVVHQVVHRVVAKGQVAIFCDHPGFLTRGMELFRKIEPHRPLVCVFEDIDAIIEMHGDSELLAWLDGSHQINKVINIATTNYPERLDRRIVSRPRRFDRIIKIESPTASMRRTYLERKLPDLAKTGELQRWVELTEGLSFAALAELVISVACLGNRLEETITLLRTLEDQHPSSREFDKPGAMGFALRPTPPKRRRSEEDIPF
ncbi:MAG: ATP-binding protein [Gemmataceae bacterium]|nr:ATP-binding protein [Gemmataceae bacterium]